MKTVPTLCASATVVGVSTAGLAIGRPDPPPPLPPPPPTAFPPASRSRLDRAPRSRPHTSYAVPDSCPLNPDGASNSRPNNERPSSMLRRPRRMTVEGAGSQLHSVMDNGNGRRSVVEDQAGFEVPDNSLRARPSWVKRLSIVSLSQASTRTSNASPLPPSPGFPPYANGSMPLSHDGSTVSMIGNAPPPPLPSNKLVKHSNPARNTDGSEQQTARSKRSTLRRPTTSHQRSATLQQRPTFLNSLADRFEYYGGNPFSREGSDGSWRQYFTPKVKGQGRRRGLSGSGDAKILTRIIPNEKHQPTLILANAVAAPTLEMEDSASQLGEDDSDYAFSRPQTPAYLNAVPLGPTPLAFPDNPADAPSRNDGATVDGRTRHSFSISDIFGTLPNSKKSRDRRSFPVSRLIRRDSKKIANVSITPIGHDNGTMAEGISERPPFHRRDTSDPIICREIYTSHSSHTGSNADISFGESSRPLSSPMPDSRTVSLDISSFVPSREPSQSASQSESLLPSPQGHMSPSARPLSHRPASPSGAPIRPSRYSMTPSEQTSTLVGSDSETRGLGSGDDEDFDFQSDTLFDSLRTRGTRASSGARGPRIETIFDESPPQLKRKLSSLRDLLPKGSFPEPDKLSVAEEEESLSTPIRNKNDRSTTGSPTPRNKSNVGFSAEIPSSPPKPLSLGTLEWDNAADEDDEGGRWSFDNESDWDAREERASSMQFATPLSLKRNNPVVLGSSPISMVTARNLATDHLDKDARSSIFDWSEPAADMSSGTRTPPRPKTVHGKKDANARGSRSAGRRVPSGLHARSQSVPVVPDVDGKRNPPITNKFGTWGVGSKGVTEDWNDDFDFSACPEGDENEESGLGSLTMVVPNNIREQQNNVLANIELLREWGLLIEELKELRSRAGVLDILDGQFTGMWQEVDAMVDLADQEADEPPMIPRLSRASSPSFDVGAFDEDPAAAPSLNCQKSFSVLRARRESFGNGGSPALSQSARSGRRKSILGLTEDIFSCPSTDTPTSQDVPPLANRPRKNSEAIARSVIEALQNRKNGPNPLSPQSATPAKKLPFDTATLKHIVPYVSGLTRRAKEAVRETEHLYSSPIASPIYPDPTLNIFKDQVDGSPSSRRSRLSRFELSTENLQSKENELVTPMKLMTVM
ncbi:uncharacterized protein K452DRAFT_120395 [Aplosporella prunicola CBS 121167]|uniref:Uncharacterized protein n=1 Tax=Aplosporella prunicola CBS 121167 TaxID=1176127 RepID=A0A6A6BRN5_9PEZI|nr:uncharacterized protein K452DRAFT_120395 [Aplosporella prunicola CBS 121167]KAF2145477.1 hypothetical protein K452DRAFT_120395 [Aplosporella prunicola CBS 121167]